MIDYCEAIEENRPPTVGEIDKSNANKDLGRIFRTTFFLLFLSMPMAFSDIMSYVFTHTASFVEVKLNLNHYVSIFLIGYVTVSFFMLYLLALLALWNADLWKTSQVYVSEKEQLELLKHTDLTYVQSVKNMKRRFTIKEAEILRFAFEVKRDCPHS